jgi:hypothetical protein
MNKTERTLSDVLGASYEHNRSEYKEKKDFKSKETKSDEELDDGEAKTFLAEMEGDNADIENIKSLDDLLIHPQEGSIIMAFKDPKRRTKGHIIKFATDSFIPNLAPILFSDEIPLEMYVIFRLVLPHKKALAVAEKIGTLSRDHKVPPSEILAGISGMDIKSRSDVKKILMKALNYHPHIGQVLTSFLSKVKVTSG